MNRRRLKLTDRQIEDHVLTYFSLFCIILISTFILLSTLARVACAPAARLVPATHPTLPPYTLAIEPASQRQAGELADFYRNNF